MHSPFQEANYSSDCHENPHILWILYVLYNNNNNNNNNNCVNFFRDYLPIKLLAIQEIYYVHFVALYLIFNLVIFPDLQQMLY